MKNNSKEIKEIRKKFYKKIKAEAEKIPSNIITITFPDYDQNKRRSRGIYTNYWNLNGIFVLQGNYYKRRKLINYMLELRLTDTKFKKVMKLIEEEGVQIRYN